MTYTSPDPQEPSTGSTLQQRAVASLRFSADDIRPLFVGAIVGLILGLFLAWVVWPVEYAGTVSITDLDAQTQAYYIAAVAEAYVYYGDAQALDVAEERLAPFGDDLPQALNEAIAYYEQSADPNATIYQNNIRQLQTALAADMAAAAQAEPTTAAAEAAPAPAAAEADAAGGGRGWWITLLGIALLVVAVVFLLRWWPRRGQSGAAALDEDGSAEQPPVSETPVAARSAYAQPARDTRPAIAPQAPATDYLDSEGYSFSDEPEETFKRPAAAVTDARDVDEEDLFDDDGSFDESEEEEAVEGQWSPVLPAAAAAGRSTTAAADQQPVEQLGEFTAHYRIGMLDYEESENIRSGSGPYIGEYGMGVNTKNGILQNNPEYVIALDIWLFDKAEPTNLGTQTRVLLSEYVFDSGIEDAFPRERPDDPEPIIAEAGQRFQLKGHKLLLDCAVVEANYVASGPAKGIFESVKVAMTVRRTV